MREDISGLGSMDSLSTASVRSRPLSWYAYLFYMVLSSNSFTLSYYQSSFCPRYLTNGHNEEHFRWAIRRGPVLKDGPRAQVSSSQPFRSNVSARSFTLRTAWYRTNSSILCIQKSDGVCWVCTFDKVSQEHVYILVCFTSALH